MRYGKQPVTDLFVAMCRRLMIGAVALVATVPAIGQNSYLQQRLDVASQTIAENKQKLRSYQWTETTQLSLKGEAKPPSQSLCWYGPDGRVQKSPIGPPPTQSSSRLKKIIPENKDAKMKEYIKEVKGLLEIYVPFDPQKMRHAYQAGKVSLDLARGMNLIFTDYAQPGDQMTIILDDDVRRIISVNISTYIVKSLDAVTLQIQMASLPDGTDYVQQAVIRVKAKQLEMTTTNSNHQKLGGI